MKSWRSFNAAVALVFLAALTIGCHRGTESESPLETFGRPESVAEVLASPHPFELYGRLYGAFEFESKTTVAHPPEAGEPLNGFTVLRRNELGNFEITRKPLSGNQTVAARFADGKAYVKNAGATEFLRVRHQREFNRWADAAFSEVFSLLRQAGFDGSRGGTAHENSICWSQPKFKLCADPSTFLPLSGTVTFAKADEPAVTIDFRVTTRPAGTIFIDIPK